MVRIHVGRFLFLSCEAAKGDGGSRGGLTMPHHFFLFILPSTHMGDGKEYLRLGMLKYSISGAGLGQGCGSDLLALPVPSFQRSPWNFAKLSFLGVQSIFRVEMFHTVAPTNTLRSKGLGCGGFQVEEVPISTIPGKRFCCKCRLRAPCTGILCILADAVLPEKGPS